MDITTFMFACAGYLLNPPGFQRVYANLLFEDNLFLSSEMNLKDLIWKNPPFTIKPIQLDLIS